MNLLEEKCKFENENMNPKIHYSSISVLYRKHFGVNNIIILDYVHANG